jgi:DNA invertase Pin-like site-specific DNA recombinase
VKIGYMRVSTGNQSTDSQEDDLIAAGVAAEHIYRDKLSGKNTNRPELKECLRAIREGDTLVITRLSRLCRSLGDLLAIMASLEAKGVKLHVIHQKDVSTDSPTGKLVRSILGAVDEFQRDIIVENTREGLAAAKARGRVGGRKPGLDEKRVRAAKQMRAEGGSITEIAATLKVSRATVYRHLNETSKDGTEAASSNLPAGKP